MATNMLQGNDAFEDSMLKSILLFHYTDDHKMVIKRQDFLLMAILAIITDGNGQYTETHITQILQNRFAVTDINLSEKIQQLIKTGRIIKAQGQNTYQATDTEANGQHFLDTINTKTESLYESIVRRVNNQISCNNREEIQIRKNIRSALSVYFQQYSYSFYGLQRKHHTKPQDVNTIAMYGLRSELGHSLVGAIADVLDTPSSEEKTILEQWARAYITMAILNMDPDLRNFKITNFRKKEFIIDTDFALSALTDHAKYSPIHQQIVKILRSYNCKIYIPQDIIDEIQDHINAANKQYQHSGSSWAALTDELLESVTANIFVEDYVKTVRAGSSDLKWITYINNFFDPNDPSFLIDKIKSIFGNDIIIIPTEALKPITEDIQKKLAKDIEDRTSKSAKGAKRPPEQNMKIAQTDAALFLTIKDKNNSSNQTNKPFDQKVYLLTRTTKVLDCAKFLDLYKDNDNFICNPSALYSILQEIGAIRSETPEYINLFDNPFLTYTAELIWGQVQPLLEAGAQLQYADINRLRHDVDVHLNNILTCTTLSSKAQEADRLQQKGYLFAQDFVQMHQHIQSQSELLDQKDKLLQEKDKIIAQLRSQLQQSRPNKKLRRR